MAEFPGLGALHIDCMAYKFCVRPTINDSTKAVARPWKAKSPQFYRHRPFLVPGEGAIYSAPPVRLSKSHSAAAMIAAFIPT